MSSRPGPLAFVGGAEWSEGCDFDAKLLEASGGTEVLVLPTAAAYEGAPAAVERAGEWFSSLGATVRGLMVINRRDAEDPDNATAVRAASFIYLSRGSSLHLRSVLKLSPLWDAIQEAWRGGAVLAGSSAGAMVLGDPMVDPRGGAFTLGLGLMESLAILPHASTWSRDRLHRTTRLAPAGVALVAIDERTAVVRSPVGEWSASGAGDVTVYRDGQSAGLEALPR